MKKILSLIVTLFFFHSISVLAGSGMMCGGAGGGSGAFIDDDQILWGTGPDQVSLDDVPDGIVVKLGQDASPTGTPTFFDIILTNALSIVSGGTGATTAEDARTNLGLGTIATQNANSVSITGGSINGITDLAIADGGTGSSSAPGARTNLGAAASGANSDITSLSGLTTPLSIAQGGTAGTSAGAARANLSAAALGTNSDITSLTGVTGAIQAPTQVNDSSGNEVLKFGSAGSAVNEVTITNAATTNSPTIAATGDDTDIDLAIIAKGSGTVIIPDVQIGGGTISGITDLAVTDGGTGASTPEDARANLSAAESGINSDITELAGLVTPLTVGQGGTGTSTAPTDGEILIGKTDGTYAVTGLTAGSNVTITPGDGTITINANLGSTPSAGFYLFDEYFAPIRYNSSTGTGAFHFIKSASGTGATINDDVGEQNAPGIAVFTTGTTSSGTAGLITDGEEIRFGGGVWTYETRVKIDDLSDGSDTFSVITGFGENTSYVDAALFRYTHSENSGNFTCVTRDNSVETAVDSTVPFAADTWYKLRITVNAAGSSVDFAIDGTSRCTITTNIPTGSGRATGLTTSILKSAGTTDRGLWADYTALSFIPTSPR